MDYARPMQAPFQTSFELQTRGRGTYELSARVQRFVAESGIRCGLCHVFVAHTSASLIICENADPDVREDLETFAVRFAPDGAPMFIHRAEGPDDMAAHVRSVFTQAAISLPVAEGRLAIGTWQGIYLWEHRHAAHRRRVTLTLIGS